MFELLALLTVVAIAGMVVLAAVFALKLAVNLVFLPFKLLFFPIVAIVAVVKVVFIVAVGVTIAGVAIAIFVPLVVVALVLAVPIALIAALT